MRSFAAILSLLVLPLGARAQADSLVGRTDYRNEIFTAAPTNAPNTSLSETLSVAIYSGSLGDTDSSACSLSTNTPADGQILLLQSIIGQPAGGVPFAYLLPGIVLNAPTSGTPYPAPAFVAFDALAWHLDGFVSRVDFYATGPPLGTNVLVGSITNSQPFTNSYQLTWSNDVVGNFTLTAVATDNRGASVASSSVNIGVVPVILVNGAYTNTHTFTFLATNQITILMTNPVPGGHILYTTDGSDPKQSGQPYQGPFSVTNSTLVRAVTTDDGYSPLQEVDSVSIVTIPLYSVSASTPGGGSVAVSNCCGPYPSNSIVTVTATTSNGWTLLGWTGDVVTNASSFSLTVNTNKSVQAIFGTGLNIKTNVNGSILATPSTNLYPYGSTVRLTAVPNPQFHFSLWQDAATFGTSNSPLNFSVTSTNPVISAIFLTNSANFFALNVQIGAGDGAVTRAPFATQYTNGTSVNLTATPASGQLFVNWVVNNVPSGSSTNLTVLMTTNKTVVANFSPPTPPYIAITNPLAGATFMYQAAIPVSVSTTSAVGSVVRVGFYGGGSFLGTVSNAPFNFTWTNAPPGTNILTAVATDNFGFSGTSGPVSVTVTLPPPGPPVFSLTADSYSVFETNGLVAVTVLKSFNSLAGTVNYATSDDSALAVSNGLGNYFSKTGSLSFATGETSRQVSVLIKDNSPYYVGNRTFNFSLSVADTNATAASPSNAVITIIDVNSPPTANSFTTSIFPDAVPPHTGQLSVYLLPTNSGGQWRLVREKFWRDSGDIVSRLASGRYEAEFKTVPGFLPPENITKDVSAGALTMVTNRYPISLSPTPTGPLTVTIQPPSVANASDINARGQWRLLGQSNWLDSAATLTNLLATNQIIEFKSIPSYDTPPLRAVLVAPNPNNSVEITYESSGPDPNCSPPGVVPYNLVTNARPSLPYLYTGQLLSEVGYGSGCVVKKRVVLTAAHTVFNDGTLAFASPSNVKWFFQRYAGQFEPPTQTPRGWYVLSGYASARTNDVHDLGAGNSSPASQSLDAAALYFFENAGRGGQSGYLVSDPTNQWLTSGALMTLVGYPVENVTEATRGQVYSTPIFDYIFDPVTNGVFSTADICGYPGMSGGPLFVFNDVNNTFHPAAVYLGGSDEAIVRTIDASVADLINRADATAHTGNNNTGGGVILISSSATGGGNAYLEVTLGPQAAIDAGGGWRVQGGSIYVNASDALTYFTQAVSITIEFNPVSGWEEPPTNTVSVTPGQTTVIDARYLAYSNLVVTPAGNLASSGYAGGPFTPASTNYTLSNPGEAVLTWSASSTSNWLTLLPSSGKLAGGASTNVAVNINANASALGTGTYTNTVSFVNTTNGMGNTTRFVTLSVSVHTTILLTNMHLLDASHIAMALQGVPGKVYSILGTTNLLVPITNWSVVVTNLTNTAGQTTFTITNPPGPASAPRFYRARELP